MDIVQSKWGKNLKELRKQAKLSQSEVGKKLNLTSQAVANYENGKRDISSSMLLKFAELYNVPVSKILGVSSDYLPDSYWEETLTQISKTDEHFTNDFEVQILGNISKSAYTEVMCFVDYIKYKYGHTKK